MSLVEALKNRVNHSQPWLLKTLNALFSSSIRKMRLFLTAGVFCVAQPSEGSNEFLRLLKSHKEKMEEAMKELRRKNEELEKEKMESEKEKEGLLTTVEQLRVKLTQFTQVVILITYTRSKQPPTP